MGTYEELTNRPLPDRLYHYTTQAGLLGIVTSKELWATKIQYLNDSQEFLYAIELARSLLQYRLSKAQDQRDIVRLNTLIDETKTIEKVNVCVFSLSGIGDMLSQWRAYSTPHSGFSIVFSPQHLRELAAKNGFVLAPCVYDPTEQEDLINEIIDTILAQDFNVVPSRPDPNRERTIIALPVGGDFAQRLAELASLVKNPAFKEEAEWRLVSRQLDLSNPNFSFRTGQSMLTPYFRLPMLDPDLRDLVLEVVSGPSPHPDLSAGAASSALSKYGFSPRVTYSQVPYRNW